MKVTIADSNEIKVLRLNKMTTNRKMEINDYTDGVLLQLQGSIPVSNTTIFELIKIIDELLQELNHKT